jgi:hypothetical protein
MPVILLPASATPFTASEAPAPAATTTLRTTFVALSIMPRESRFVRNFLPELFLLAPEEPDFLAADFFFVAFFSWHFAPFTDGLPSVQVAFLELPTLFSAGFSLLT